MVKAYDPARGWALKEADGATVVAWLRGALGNKAVGARPLKPTTLSWAAKFGLNRGDRRLLGYHAKPKDRSMTLYSRDELAAPLRSLGKGVAAIRDGNFDPDACRSGYLKES